MAIKVTGDSKIQ